MSAAWCDGRPGNGYDGHHGHRYDPRGVDADKPPEDCTCTDRQNGAQL